jgi:2-amino-4-hydroxy-6-hydroxymethyldihydropteridine diphosphokinase
MDASNLMKAYISIGSNIDNRAGYILLAIVEMMKAGLKVDRLSSVYETEPMELLEQPRFLNMVVEISGELPAPEDMLDQLLKIEKKLGRRREIPNGPRTIDLDILFFADLQIESDSLILPHPRLHLRHFVLIPLAELAPNLIHPKLNRTIQELLLELGPNLDVKQWRID